MPGGAPATPEKMDEYVIFSGIEPTGDKFVLHAGKIVGKYWLL
jgi:hypothetical protein